MAISWQSTFAFWGADFPAPGSSDAHWDSFWLTCFRLPALLLVVGTLTAGAVLFILCRVHIRAQDKNQNRLLTHFLLLALLNLVCFGLGIYLSSSGNYAQAADTLAAAEADIEEVHGMAEALNISAVSFQHDLAELYSECPASTHEFLGDSVVQRKKEARHAEEFALLLDEQLSGIPQWLGLAAVSYRSAAVFIDWCMALPIILLVLCYGAIGFLVALTEFSGHNCLRRCRFCHLPCLAWTLIGPAVLVISVVASLEAFLAVTSSAFCGHPDLVVLSYAEEALGPESPSANLTRQYLLDEVSTVALKDLKVIQGHFSLWHTWVDEFAQAIDKSCAKWDAVNVSRDIKVMAAGLHTASLIMEPSHIYPYYLLVVDSSCTGISRLGSLIVFHLGMGLLGLPLLACGASCLLESLVAERVAYGFDLLSTVEPESN